MYTPKKYSRNLKAFSSFFSLFVSSLSDTRILPPSADAFFEKYMLFLVVWYE